ncbi:glycine cleavage system aminomethyltransferase GcvT [Acidobacteria bacterium ACD]|nr:MAG: glycine cleavage system aminomethyltransferase GcvT [Acidobacteriota bacterium]MCE7957361.1 glycine cleavage system aminomethyltransferase GcvT [Acidobacteria bacterium ACB2]MDL1950771.1 glycine cleavage system aminomethyltransferase GcvT [Acidobacteria bacterium ACD]
MRTPLHDRHRSLGGRLVEFGGWEMPVQFSGLVDEHVAVRTRAGLFDVSHMGEIRVRGPRALEVVQRLTTNDAAALVDGKIQYSAFLTERGTFVDDLLTYRIAADDYFLVVNAGNTPKDVAWAKAQAVDGGTVEDQSPQWAQIALQGPRSVEILQPLTEVPLAPMGYYHFALGKVVGVPSIVSRTGYTGEDGFEVYCPPDDAPRVWDAILESGRPFGCVPCGLGARDTLRLEAKMALYGNDIDDTTTPWEADLGWIVKMKKGDFIGRDALERQKAAGVARKLVGFEVTGRGIARHGYPLTAEGGGAGVVTSGTQTPTVGKAIGLAYVPAEKTAVGTPLVIDVRGKGVPAVVVPTPFYKRPSA